MASRLGGGVISRNKWQLQSSGSNLSLVRPVWRRCSVRFEISFRATCWGITSGQRCRRCLKFALLGPNFRFVEFFIMFLRWVLHPLTLKPITAMPTIKYQIYLCKHIHELHTYLFLTLLNDWFLILDNYNVFASMLYAVIGDQFYGSRGILIFCVYLMYINTYALFTYT